MRTSRLLLASGLVLGSAIAVLGFFIPGGGQHWFLHVRTSTIGIPLSLALIAAGAVVGRLERSDAATHFFRD